MREIRKPCVFISCLSPQIFRHTTEEPIFYMGTGRANFTEHQGNFDIEDETLTMLPLQDFSNVTVGADNVTLIFTTAEDPDLLVSVRTEGRRTGRNMRGRTNGM